MGRIENQSTSGRDGWTNPESEECLVICQAQIFIGNLGREDV